MRATSPRTLQPYLGGGGVGVGVKYLQHQIGLRQHNYLLLCLQFLDSGPSVRRTPCSAGAY